jgi:hypothetical protein
MRKFTFILPVAAILLAAVVVAAEFGSPISAQSPEPVAALSAKDAEYADDDVTAVTWSETSVRVPDSTKPRLPSPKVKLKKKKK